MLVCVLRDVIVLAVFWESEMQATVARGLGMHKGTSTTNSNNARSARTAFDRESVDPEAQINLVNSVIGPVVGGNIHCRSISSYTFMPKGNQG
jgi:hypothetical protein